MEEKKDYTSDSVNSRGSESDRCERLLANAYDAYAACELAGAKWGQQYWSNVVASLTRKFRRLN